MTRNTTIPVATSESTASPTSTSTSTKQAENKDNEYTIHTRLLFDPLTKSFLSNISLTISRTTGLITTLHKRSDLSPSTHPHLKPTDLDLTDLPLILPGLTDAHTHIFLHTYSTASSNVQETQESPVERILRATNHLRAALKAGFTTYRDLGTEGLFTADIDVRNAINRGLIPGPRLFVAGEAIASSGGYAVRAENDASASLGTPYAGPGSGFALATTSLGRVSDQADGVDGVRAAVRRRLASGADLVKVYADYRSRSLRWPASSLISRPNDPNAEIRFPPAVQARSPAILLWTQEELSALVAQANSMGATVAAHAFSARAVLMAVNAGVTSIEHGIEDEITEAEYHPFTTPLAPDEALKAMARRHTIWIPTLRVIEAEYPAELFARACERVKRGWKLGVRIGFGGDTGPVSHGGNAREMKLLVQRCGIPMVDVLRAATMGGWEAVWGREVLLHEDHDVDENENGDGNAGIRLGSVIGRADTDQTQGQAWTGEFVRSFGALREGWVADLVGLGGDVRDDLDALDDVRIVIKDGAVVVKDGVILQDS